MPVIEKKIHRRARTLGEITETLRRDATNLAEERGSVNSDKRVFAGEYNGWQVQIVVTASGFAVMAGYPEITFTRGDISITVTFPTIDSQDATVHRGGRRIIITKGIVTEDTYATQPDVQPPEHLMDQLQSMVTKVYQNT